MNYRAKRVIQGSFILLAFLLTIWVASALLPRQRLLTKDASRVPGVYFHEHQIAFDGGDQYWWLSDHKILWFYSRVDNDDHIHSQFSCWDTQTGRSKRLAGVEVLYTTTSGGYIEPSPDGLALLWENESKPGFTIVSLDASWHMSYPSVNKGIPNYAWLPDSRHWLEMTIQGGEDTPEKARYTDATIRSVSSSEPATPAPAVLVAMLQGLRGGTRLMATRNGRLIAISGGANVYEKRGYPIIIIDAALDGRQPAITSYTIPFPSDTRLDTIEITPQGNRIAWLLREKRPQPWHALLHRFFGGFDTPARETINLCVSNLDGSGMHDVGAMPVTPAMLGAEVKQDFTACPGMLAWKPDGKHLSFSYNKELWVIPAD